LLNHLRTVAEGVRVEVETTSADSARRLAQGDFDFAVGYMPHLGAGFYQRTLSEENFVCLAARRHPRVGTRLSHAEFMSEGHIVVTMSGTGHSIVDKALAELKLQPNVALRLPSFLGVARIVAQTELLGVVPRGLGEACAAQEKVKVLPPPVKFPSYPVNLHWHERFHTDAGNQWIRQVMADLFTRKG
ncbi:MAG: LysR substrate-binding domain-containing protein, partial [Variovorax sp.]